MEAKIKTEDITVDEWEMIPELKLECKEEPITELIPTHLGYVTSDLRENSEYTEDVKAATPEQSSDANIPDTSDDSKEASSLHLPQDGDSLVYTDVEDSRDAFQDNFIKVEGEVVPSSDITPASGRDAEDEPECLGPFYRPTKCPVCSEEIRDEHAADKHRCFISSLTGAGYRSITFVPPSGLKCPLCEAAVYYYPRGFKKHVRSHFMTVYFSCSICGKKFRAKETFVTHSYIHSGRWPYRCRECGLGCASVHNLEKHELLHTDQKAAVCEICGDSFKSKQCLVRHKEKHVGKLYPCTICNKVYKLSEYLKRHLERHKASVEPKKYKCDLCGNLYRTSQGLISHRDKYHFQKERVKKYSCSICNKSTNSLHHFENHIASHTGEKRFTCDICEKKFSTKTAIARHIAEHSGDRKYSCDVCGMKFTQASSVKRHKGTAHR